MFGLELVNQFVFIKKTSAVASPEKSYIIQVAPLCQNSWGG